jgi:hypothetical protein
MEKNIDNKMGSLKIFFRITKFAMDIAKELEIATKGHSEPSELYNIYEQGAKEFDKENPDPVKIEAIMNQIEQHLQN